MRLDKFLAHCGYGTRKDVKKLIKSKLVTVNGEVVKDNGQHIEENIDKIFVAEEQCFYEQFIYIMMNKRSGLVSAREDGYEQTVLDEMDVYYYQRDVAPVGRLDKDTTGLLLLTNDGKLAHALLSPKKHVDKVYRVNLTKAITAEMINKLESGVELEDGFLCKPAKVEQFTNLQTINLTIQEGKFHQVKRMMLAVDNEVVALERIAMGPLKLDVSLGYGEFRPLSADELTSLLVLK
jgi:pseudouridine synthase